MWSCLFLCKKCERLLLYLYCHELSIEFQEPVPASVSLLKNSLWFVFLHNISKSLELSSGRNWLLLLEACTLDRSKSCGGHPVLHDSERDKSWSCSFSMQRLYSHSQTQIYKNAFNWQLLNWKRTFEDTHEIQNALGELFFFLFFLGQCFKWKEKRKCLTPVFSCKRKALVCYDRHWRWERT